MKSSLKLVIVFELFEGAVGFEYIRSSFPDRKRSPQYPIFSEMKSSLKLVVILELFEGVVGSEYIHSSFSDRKRFPEYPIFSEMKSFWDRLEIFSSPYETQAYMSLFAADQFTF